MHLAGSKKIQQALAEEGVLEKFMPNDATEMRKVFAGLYSYEGEKNMQKTSIALNVLHLLFCHGFSNTITYLCTYLVCTQMYLQK